MNFKKVNNITGWVIFFIAFATYFLTREARGSLWDCGEFVACADKMQLPHPPGAPLFVLLGRFFIILFGDNGMTAANAVNFMSVLASAATILFLFWTVTHFARKIMLQSNESLNKHQTFVVLAAGAVGALAYTFSDSFWFSAVEGEVYALSSFFTALVFWAMLKWEHSDERAGNDQLARARSDRWIIFLFFMMGLSIGVHLLNLLTIPAVVMIYYYRRFNATTKGAIIAFIISCIITGLVQVGVVTYTMKSAGLMDIFFTNTLGFPFFSGFAFYFILLAAVIFFALRFKENKTSSKKMMIFFLLFIFLSFLPFIFASGTGGAKFGKFLLLSAVALGIGYFLKPTALRVVKLTLWSYAFMMLGYLMYLTPLIRSNANPAIDMNNVDNPINLVYYLSREQYGQAPLVYGPHFSAEYKYDDNGNVEFKKGEMQYVKGDKKYIPIGVSQKPKYQSADMQIFPRIWDSSNDQYHADFYAEWLNIGTETSDVTGRQRYSPPTFADNMEWFFSYQMGLMYWRYFMWNFAGKQNDVQGLGNKRDGNWITGISMIDNNRLGDQSKLPDTIKANKAHNKLYLLPFILGILGCVFQFFRNKKDWVVNFLLFFMTGIAVVIYLNQPGNQPRERDYAYVGSFYAFAIWIGLAVPALIHLAKEKKDKLTFQNVLTGGTILTFLIAFMSASPGTFNDMFMTGIYSAILFALITGGLSFILRAISSGGKNLRTLNLSTTVVCLAVPLLMAQQEWDDHDRHNKTTAPDIAKNYLESCAPNAILFTFGDNDTYPLWYAQEVEGVRPDVRIINNSLLGIDWYINQLRYKINDADSVDVIWTKDQVAGHNREYLRYTMSPNADPNKYYPLYDVMKDILGKNYYDPDTKIEIGPNAFPVARQYNPDTKQYDPVARFSVPVDTALVRKNGTVLPGDSVLSEMDFEIPQAKLKGGLVRSDFIILNIIAANHWKRPIYFSSAFGELGFSQFLRKDGMAYRLVPIITKNPQDNWVAQQAFRQNGLGSTSVKADNLDFMYKTMMTEFRFGGAQKNNVYFDEENRRHILAIRSLFGEAAGNLADEGKKEEAQKLLDKAEAGIKPENLPYGLVSRYNMHNQTTMIYLEGCYKADKKDLAERVREGVTKDLNQQFDYYAAMGGMSRAQLDKIFDDYEAQRNQAQLKLAFAQTAEQQQQARMEMNQADMIFSNSLKDRQTGMRTEIIIARSMLKILDAIVSKYAPEVKAKEQPKTETPSVINNQQDSTKSTDSSQ
ncbi:MAG: DUF2723 domain-containing protein [Chitinophagaceae bacterium]|nr:DUF2723 domain-containing protein [Chitinophagaceae bacterium]